jgi:NAD(P)-dependent dehydrogenase (short-subunit alcohol dehydrogenase family)
LNRGVEIPRALGRVLVSGGNSGLGRAIVDAVHAAGGSAVSLDVRGGRPGDMVVDVADRRAVSAAIDEVASRYGEITAVVTSAGVDACGPFGQVDAGEWERVIGVNLLGTASIVRAALPYLERSRGHIVTVASTLGLRAVSDATAYCASKFGVIGFSRALAVELKDRVKLTCLIPGGMHTNFFEGRTEQYKPPADARLNDPKHVADAVVFALSQPPECEIREMVVCPSAESSWP